MNDFETEEVLDASPEGLRRQALQRLKKRRDFHAHLFVYLMTNILLWGIWLTIALSSDDRGTRGRSGSRWVGDWAS